ncbi:MULTISPECIES: RraA family protein [Mycobacteroides]|uniref:RraA family protein n=1 Tax=Mycobacteroides TaxID=670516 RepID=UPI000A4949C1|nr:MULTISPECIES: RraA family protein [Mycobacteroides]
MSSQDRNSIRARYLSVETPNVSDVLDEFGFPGQALSADFAPRSGSQLAGWAFTISGDSVAGGPPTDLAKVQACSEVQDGDITVWAGNGNGACFFGELIALGLQGLGCRGALIDGGVRDLAWLEQAGFATFSTYRTPVQSIGRWQVQSWAQSVLLPGATCRTVEVGPGDFILGDIDGVVVVPAAHVLPVLERAEAVTLRERGIRQGLKDGMSLQEAIARYGAI